LRERGDEHAAARLQNEISGRSWLYGCKFHYEWAVERVFGAGSYFAERGSVPAWLEEIQVRVLGEQSIYLRSSQPGREWLESGLKEN
jgi:hypothetical protein